MSERLQGFDYQSSPYHRPNQKWVCGRLGSGDCCTTGPDPKGRCGAGPQCKPVRDGDRWRCTRGPLHGGPCNNGPQADGICACLTPPCRPNRSWKYRRKLAVRSTLTATLGLIVLALAGTWAGSMVEPGHLAAAHSTIDDCESCHATTGRSASAWLAAAFGQHPDLPVDTQHACLTCHDVGEAPLAPHSLATLPTAGPAQGSTLGPWTVELNRMVFPDPETPIACGTCHQEHEGASADLRAVPDSQCQVCHDQRFGSFVSGHPEFSDYPYDRRTRIIFDHASHLGKHFADEPEQAPQSCSGCHVTATDGRTMEVRGFDDSCGACHAGDIAGNALAGPKGVAGLAVPGLDLTLVENIGQWPEFADGDLTPMTELLLMGDPEYASVRDTLADVDLLDLDSATPEQRGAATTLAWQFKALVDAIQSKGSQAVVQRLEAALGHPLTTDEQRRLTGLLPASLVDTAQAQWFPSLTDELNNHRAGNAPATEAVRPMADEPEADDDNDAAVADDEFDALFSEDSDEGFGDLFADDADDESGDLFGGDLFGGGDVGDPFADPQEDATPEPEVATINHEERMALGGWYLDEFTLRYRPAGHADPVVRTWTELATRQPAAEDWLAPDNPGACTQCHSLESDASGVTSVQWLAKRIPATEHHFTEFDHSTHFSLLGDAGCGTCHQIDNEAPYADSFEGRDPSQFTSNFAALEKTVCLDCHQPDQAGTDCASCHRYHVGDFKATMPNTQLSRSQATR